MTKNEVTLKSPEIFEKVSEYYGYSKFHDSLPYLLIEMSPYSDADEPNCFGEYDKDENDLVIYWKNIDSLETLIRTIIHEYQHYLQSPTWFTRHYRNGHGYNTHPYEIAATNEENKWEYFIK